MTVRDGKGRWWVAGVGLGVFLIGLGVFLLRVGLEDADRWGSVFGVFLNIAGLAVAVYSAVCARRAAVSPKPGAGGEVTSQIHGGQFTSLVLQGRDMHSGAATASPDQPGTGTADAGTVHNRIEDGTFGGLVIQGRDMHGLVLPPSGDAGTQPGQQEQTR
jgi:hypothetical protein